MSEENVIDCDVDPYCPPGWAVEEHRKAGKLQWSEDFVQLWLSDEQQCGAIQGTELREELADMSVLNACVLDWLLEHPDLIPEEWKNNSIFFWGTIYRYSDGELNVRYLCWRGDDMGWCWHFSRLCINWYGHRLAALAA